MAEKKKKSDDPFAIDTEGGIFGGGSQGEEGGGLFGGGGKDSVDDILSGGKGAFVEELVVGSRGLADVDLGKIKQDSKLEDIEEEEEEEK
jgi:hypothetical protein